jgi:glycerol-3-phosphate dehydrogenase (NAD(P)+)
VKAQTIAVIGAGSWGTALSLQLARNGHEVRLWGHEPEHIERIRKDGENAEFLPGIKLPENIHLHTDLAASVDSAALTLIVIPSHAYQDFLGLLKPLVGPDSQVFWASKGFEIETGKFLHELVVEQLQVKNYGVISGPTFATEVARDLPAAVTCAGSTEASTRMVAELLHGGHFRCYMSNDIVGVEIGGALKNVLAIGVGAVDGLGLGANTRAALITRGLAELMRFGESMGAQRETLMGLSGLGDLILTSTDDQSRNRRFGLAIGRGMTVDQAMHSVHQTVEGYRAARAVYQLGQKHQVSLPIIDQVYQILYQNKNLQQAIADLEKRQLKTEF